jgi:hypothetical protein
LHINICVRCEVVDCPTLRHYTGWSRPQLIYEMWRKRGRWSNCWRGRYFRILLLLRDIFSNNHQLLEVAASGIYVRLGLRGTSLPSNPKWCYGPWCCKCSFGRVYQLIHLCLCCETSAHQPNIIHYSAHCWMNPFVHLDSTSNSNALAQARVAHQSVSVATFFHAPRGWPKSSRWLLFRSSSLQIKILKLYHRLRSRITKFSGESEDSQYFNNCPSISGA